MNKRRLGRPAPRGLQQVQRAASIGIEIIKRDLRRAVVRRLRRGMHDCRRPYVLDQTENAFAIAYINLAMLVSGNVPSQARQRPGSIALGSKEYSTLVVI